MLTATLLLGPAGTALAITPAPGDLPQTPTVDITEQVVDLTFPVANTDRDVRFIDDFLRLRGGGSRLHAATDLMAPKHRPIVAAVGGTITWAPYPEPSYGWMVSIRGDDGRRYSYVHLNNDTPQRDADGRWLDDDAGGVEHAYAPRIVEAIRTDGSATGLRVERGELIGWNGDSGNAKGVVSHLHFEIEVTDPDATYRINPYHSLVAALDRGDVVDDEPAPATSGDGEADQPDAPTETDWREHGGLFADVNPDGTHGPAIEALVRAGVLEGCTDERYCPADSLPRGDLAVAIAAALELPTASELRDAPFPDVPVTDPRAGAIAAVDEADVLHGYTDGSFGPEEALSRAQLASVLVRGFQVPDATHSAGFEDVRPGSAHADAIDAIAEVGVTNGCSDDGRFCGHEDVRRDRIASFLARGIEFGSR
ncbi:MAG: S-layer homology domain-containing protein [Nitriliruptoraceae bacterium]